MRHDWETRLAGRDCPFDKPAPVNSDSLFFVRSLQVSSLYLDRNQNYRGHCLLIFDPRHVARIDQLTGGEWAALSRDLYVAECAIFRALRPDHINVESLGNVTPHLHWHITPRNIEDDRWGGAIWTTSPEEMGHKTLTEGEYRQLADIIDREVEILLR
ncbi:MAG: HIT family protein [Gammaproteobacteria bacterium]|nr:MAG: HIT family protein [Gammaproteobacteria bacterium]